MNSIIRAIDAHGLSSLPSAARGGRSRRVAVVGSGIAGLSAAWLLSAPGQPPGRRGAVMGTDSRASFLDSAPDPACRVTLYEAEPRAGGHAHTVDVTLPGASGASVTHGVDTGFLVFNHRTYPRLMALFDELGVRTVASDMSFSVQADGGALEWCGSSLDTVFAQRRNLLRPRFVRMLAEVLRFNRTTTAIARDAGLASPGPSIGEFLDLHGFSRAFRDWYLLPMLGCIWSCPTEQMLRFPVATMARFCHNHGLLQVTDRPQWYTVEGGSREYVQRMLSRIGDVRLSSPVRAVERRHGRDVVVSTDAGTEAFDDVVFACHPDQALRILGDDARDAERAVLGAIGYHANRAVLHTDASLLPRRRRAWAAWNYERAGDADVERSGVCLHYLINRLQPLPFAQPVIVSLNPVRQPRPETVLASFNYDHPVFDHRALAAQRRVPSLQGRSRTWYCGAWCGYGFHEDGLASATAVVEGLRASRAGDDQRLAA